MSTQELEAVRQSITVEAPIERVFTTFVEQVSAWWPLASHSYGGEETERAVLEPREGGRFYEVQTDGTEASWGTVLAWEPPHRILLRWEIRGCEGTEVDVHFSDDGNAATRVDLEHRGWEELAAGGASKRGNYDEGWAMILQRFSGVASSLR